MFFGVVFGLRFFVRQVRRATLRRIDSAWLFMFLYTRREDEGRRRRFRRREGDEAGGGGVDHEDPTGEEDGYGAFYGHARSEEIYQDLCSLHLPPPLSATQVIFVHFRFLPIRPAIGRDHYFYNYSQVWICLFHF